MGTSGRKLGVALGVLLMAVSAASPVQAHKVPEEDLLSRHAIEFVSSNPDVYSDPKVFEQYTRERMKLLGMTDDEPGDVSDLSCGSFCYIVTQVHTVTVKEQREDKRAFPVWEATLAAWPGSGGMSGNWEAEWSTSTSSSWHIDAYIEAEVEAFLVSKMKGHVGGGYERTTTTSWKGKTTHSYNIPDGYQQTLYGYEKGRYWTFSAYATVRTNGGYETQITISNISGGVEAWPYQSTFFELGPLLPFQGVVARRAEPVLGPARTAGPGHAARAIAQEASASVSGLVT